MTAYIAATDVTLTLPAGATVTGSSTPLSLAEVASWCDEVGAELDAAAAAAGYAAPVASTYQSAWAQLRKYSRTGVAAMVLGVLAPNLGAPGGKMTLAGEYRAEYERILERIREGTLRLVGAPDDATGTERELTRSYETTHAAATDGGATSRVGMGMIF